jgi:hypothetical protein
MNKVLRRRPDPDSSRSGNRSRHSPRPSPRDVCEWLVGQVGRGRVVLEMAPNGAGVVAAMQATDQPQGQVDASGHTLAGDEVAVDE